MEKFFNHSIFQKMIYSSIFRVAIGVILLLDTLINIYFRKDFYQIPGFNYSLDNTLPFLLEIRENILLFLLIYCLALILMIFGVFGNATILLVLILYNIELLLVSPYYFWGDVVLQFSLLYFVFVNSFQYFAINKKEGNSLFSKLAILSIMLHLCYVYFANAVHKISDDSWLSGNSIAYFFEYAANYDLLNIGSNFKGNWLVIKFLTWSTLIFQLAFPFFIWFKKLKFPILIIGVVMHFFMALTLQLYKFELIVLLHYGFFLEDHYWKAMFVKLKIKID